MDFSWLLFPMIFILKELISRLTLINSAMEYSSQAVHFMAVQELLSSLSGQVFTITENQPVFNPKPPIIVTLNYGGQVEPALIQV